MLPAGTAVICHRYVSDWLLTSRLPLPSKVTRLPTVTFCVTPALATGAVLGVLLQPVPGKIPKTAEQPELPPPPQATSKVVSRAMNETRNVVFMGSLLAKRMGDVDIFRVTQPLFVVQINASANQATS